MHVQLRSIYNFKKKFTSAKEVLKGAPGRGPPRPLPAAAEGDPSKSTTAASSASRLRQSRAQRSQAAPAWEETGKVVHMWWGSGGGPRDMAREQTSERLARE